MDDCSDRQSTVHCAVQASSDSLVGESATLGDGCVIKRSTVGKHCVLGDHVRLTTDTCTYTNWRVWVCVCVRVSARVSARVCCMCVHICWQALCPRRSCAYPRMRLGYPFAVLDTTSDACSSVKKKTSSVYVSDSVCVAACICVHVCVYVHDCRHMRVFTVSVHR